MKRKTSGSKGTKLLKCLIINVLTLGLVSLFMAIIAYSGDDPSEAASLYSLISIVVSAAVSGYATARLSGEKGFVTALIAAFTFSLILLAAGLIVGGGKLFGGSFMNYGCYLGTSALFSVLGSKKRGRRKRRTARGR